MFSVCLSLEGINTELTEGFRMWCLGLGKDLVQNARSRIIEIQMDVLKHNRELIFPLRNYQAEIVARYKQKRAFPSIIRKIIGQL